MTTNAPPRRSPGRRAFLILCVFYLCSGGDVSRAQEPNAPQPVSAAQLKAAIDKLGDLDYATRTNAARTVRRSTP